MRLTVLGASTPYPRPDEPCSGYLVRSGSAAIWMDAGAGTLAELQRYIPLSALDAILVSHQHADHTSDLLTASYALRFAEERPSRPIPLYAPEGMVDAMTAFLGPSSRGGLRSAFETRELSDAGSTRVGDIDVAWGTVDHGVPAFGFRLAAGDGVLAYSGDSGPGSMLDAVLAGADTVLIEAGVGEQSSDEPALHLTPEEAGRAAAESGARRLVLTHVDGSIGAAAALERARRTFSGEVVFARRGLTLDV